jgi:hypothetical protein
MVLLLSVQHIRFPWCPIPGSVAVDARSSCGGKGAADTRLTWHIATSLFEVGHPQQTDYSMQVGSKLAAVRLSHHCAYFVVLPRATSR